MKKDRFCIPYWPLARLRAGACPAGESGDSFFFPSSVCLPAGEILFGRRGTAREQFIRGSCLYSLAGVYLLAEGATANGVLRMVWTAAVYGLEYASVILHDRSKIRDRFWNCTGMTVFLMMMGGIYSDPSLALWNMILCMAVFAVLCDALPEQLQLAASGSHNRCIPPFIATARYGLNENQVYGATAALLILSGFCSGGSDLLWYAVKGERRMGRGLVPHPGHLCPDTHGMGGRPGWRCAYILLTALYVLQFCSAGTLEKRAAFTLAAALAAAAFWRQPFIRWPEMLSLEIQLIPAAGFYLESGPHMGDRKR